MTKTALITGASSGIGHELAALFARDKYNLVLVARNVQKLKELARNLQQQYGITATVLGKDLANPGTPDEIFTELQQAGIRVDVLVNNAGTQVHGEFRDNDIQKELLMIQVNLTSLTHLTKLFLPGMIERGAGRILNVGSTGSFVPGPMNAVYCATKAYVLSFSEAIAEELRGTGVTVTTLCPGATATNFVGKAGMDNVRLFNYPFLLMDAAPVARIGYRALMKGKTVVVAGLANRLQVWSVRVSPRWMVAKFSKFLMSKQGGK